MSRDRFLLFQEVSELLYYAPQYRVCEFLLDGTFQSLKLPDVGIVSFLISAFAAA